MIYCPKCKETLNVFPVDGVQRLGCPSKACGFVFWGNPTPVAAALVHHEGQFVLAKNSEWPTGIFSLITGFVEKGEVPEKTIERELQEELGLTAGEMKFIGHFYMEKFNQLLIAYMIQAHGVMKLNDEITETLFLSAEQLAHFDFGEFELTQKIVSQALATG